MSENKGGRLARLFGMLLAWVVMLSALYLLGLFLYVITRWALDA